MSHAAGNVEKISSIDFARVPGFFAGKIDVLSLDCFDTLLWRLTAKPSDVFLDLEQRASFQALQFSGALRADAEDKARRKKLLRDQGSDVTLADIYRAYDPTLTDETLQQLSQDEIATEQANCFAFTPVVDLIRNIAKLGIKIIIVSDTYFTQDQLQQLLRHALPNDCLQAISQIFCSCDYGKSKVNGLFHPVLQTLTCSPERVLHIGDNLTADYVAARAANIPALHFEPENPYVTNLLRLQTTAANVMTPDTRSTQPFYFPFRSIFSMEHMPLDKPETLIGFASLGPVMYAFARFIQDEIATLQQQGKNPKILFLMRDAYLPSLACDVLMGFTMGSSVSISRFASIAASFQTEEDVINYLSGFKQITRFGNVAQQLLLPEKVSEPIIKVAERSDNPTAEFMRLVLRKDILRIIFNKSSEYRTRLFCYIDKNVSLVAGDTVVLVDLGYSGTTQRHLAPLFKARGVDVEGRYLLALRTPRRDGYRAGLLDTSTFDDKTLGSLVQYIALLEQLCTSNEKSVIDYDKEGNPIYSDVTLNEQQYQRLAKIQQECIRFVLAAKKFFAETLVSLSLPQLKRTALTELARMIYLPTAEELRHLQSFQFDLNLGTKDIYSLFDPKKALKGIKQRGMFFIDKHDEARRTNYPAELRIAGFELALSFMTLNRFNLDTNLSDMLLRQEPVETILTQGNSQQFVLLSAFATHDGYFSLWVRMQDSVTFHVGKRYQWLQIESAEFIEEAAFNQQMEAGHTQDAMNHLIINNMTNHGNGLLQCHADSSTIQIKANVDLPQGKFIFRLVFRPLLIGAPIPQRKADVPFALQTI